MEDAKIIVDAWMREHAERKREHMKRGMSAEQADEEATRDIRREIRNSPPIPLLR